MITFDSNLLTSYFNAKYGGGAAAGAGTGATAGTGAAKTNSPTGMAAAPAAPWLGGKGMLDEDGLVSKVLSGRRFIDEGAVVSNVVGASPDYTRLFALYQGLNALSGLAQKAQDGKLSEFALSALKTRFNSGVKEVAGYIDATKFDHIDVSAGSLSDTAKSDAGTARANPVYTGPAIVSGSAASPVKAFDGDVRFTVSAQKIGTHDPITVDIDLAGMGTQTRNMSNVVAYINDQLKAAGLQTRFAVNRTPAQPVTSTLNGKTVTLSQGQDSFGLQIKGVSSETLTLSAPVTADAVYVAQTTGDPDKKTTTKTGATQTSATQTSATQTSATQTSATKTDAAKTTGVSSQLLKFQSDESDGAALDPASQPGDPISKVGAKYWVSGEAGQTALPDSVVNVRATASGPDGSVYVLADVNDATGGQLISGGQDVALMKYDSAGKLVYTRALGAADTASGFALSVSADGKVAVAGSVTGALETAASKTTTYGSGKTAVSFTSTTETGLRGLDDSISDSFVTVLDANGVEMWTQRRGGSGADEATSVAFGDDGSVYVGGRTQSLMPGASGGARGGWDGYVMGFTDKGAVKFTLQTGGSGSDRVSQLAVDGDTLYVAGVNDNQANLTSYRLGSYETTDDKGNPLTKYTAVQTASRDLGGMGGGTISGMAVENGQIYLGGSSSNGGLLGGASVTRAWSGGQDAYALKVSEDLGDTSADVIAFYGGAGKEADARVQFVGGKAWIAGATDGEIDGVARLGTGEKAQDGYIARLNLDTGAVEYQQRYTGTDNKVNPGAVTVVRNGASVLDRLGLPQGTIQQKDSDLVIAGTSVRTGDQFYLVDPASGARKTVTIEAVDTLKTLADKIERASGHKLSVDVSKLLGKPVDQLVIKPANAASKMEILAGPAGKDALKGLGIDPGLISNDATRIMDASSSGYLKSRKPIGLNFDASLNLNSDANIQKALDGLQAVMKTVQRAYTYLKYGDPQAADSDKHGKTGGTVPTYLTNQISNYQAALNRLTGGAPASKTGLFGL